MLELVKRVLLALALVVAFLAFFVGLTGLINASHARC